MWPPVHGSKYFDLLKITKSILIMNENITMSVFEFEKLNLEYLWLCGFI